MKFLKKILMTAIALILTTNLFSQTAVQAPFTKGVNLTKWFEIWSPGIPNLRVYDKNDFIHLKEMGCDVVRVPIHFAMFLDDEDKIKSIIFDYLDQVCDWAEELQMYVVIDNHSFNSSPYPAPAVILESLKTVWPQVAARYKNRSNYILYEILNEPQFKNADWEPIQAEILKLIRKTDKKHTIVVTGANWGSLAAMCELKPLNDKNLIYTFHYYDPFEFTHQGANWSNKGIESLADIPFPYDKEKMPEIPMGTKGTYVERNLKVTYPRNATEAAMSNQLKKAAEFSEQNKVPVWCGEMGVYDLVAPEDSRNNWYRTTGKILNDYKIPFTVWGYDDAFGLFLPKSTKQYPRDLNVEVLEALGMKVPAGAGDLTIPSESPFPCILYDDFFGKKTNSGSWNVLIFNDKNSKEFCEGEYGIQIGYIDRYGALSLDMSKIDFSSVNGKADKTFLCFSVKFTDSSQGFQIRFVDTDDGKGINIPYRLSYDVKASDTKLNEWNQIQIPLSKMNDWGGWSNKQNKWYDGKGEFSFNRIASLEFAAETAAVDGQFYLDDIKIIQK